MILPWTKVNKAIFLLQSYYDTLLTKNNKKRLNQLSPLELVCPVSLHWIQKLRAAKGEGILGDGNFLNENQILGAVLSKLISLAVLFSIQMLH
jgi:hypothetical protein